HPCGGERCCSAREVAGAAGTLSDRPSTSAREDEAMPASYRGQVAVAFEVLADGLAPFLDEHMSAIMPGEDWILVAAAKLGKRRDVLVSLSDPHFQLEVLNRWWGPAFSRDL